MRRHLLHIIEAGIRRADPAEAVARHVTRRGDIIHAAGQRLALKQFRRVLLLGGGKAAAPMAGAMEEILGHDLAGGLVVTKYGHGLDLRRTTVREAGHPVPDRAGQEAALELLRLARSCGPGDLAFCLFSGGASALLPAPRPPLTLEDKQAVTSLLLGCGADIAEVNALRKHLSLLKGGGLAREIFPAATCALLVSDVVGDEPGVIASGPLAADASSFGDCLAMARRRGILARLPRPVRLLLLAGEAGEQPETVKPGDAVLDHVHTQVIASNRESLDAAAEAAREAGFAPLILTSRLEGEAREAARVLAAVAEECALTGAPIRPPACILAGGETTVTLRGAGKGGRNQELALALVLALRRCPAAQRRVHAACAGTDGTDGPTDAAGAMALPDTLERAEALGLDEFAALQENNAHPFFQALGDLVVTGPTRTNVMDMAVLLVT